MRDSSLLALHGVSRSFDGAPVIQDLSLTIGPGEKRGLIGPNGAGKSTLINVITGVLAPTAGRVVYRGVDITDVPAHRRVRRGIGRSFQILSLFGESTVGDNLRGAVLGTRPLGVHPLRRLEGIAAARDAAERMAEQMGLSEVLDRRVDTLAYGLQRRLDIALVLAQDPDLIILDEPAAGLSAEETRELVGLLDRVLAGKSLLLVEHDMNVVYALSDRITVLDYGRVLAEDTPNAVRADPEVQRVYLGEAA